jgi:hypothetical protein
MKKSVIALAVLLISAAAFGEGRGPWRHDYDPGERKRPSLAVELGLKTAEFGGETANMLGLGVERRLDAFTVGIAGYGLVSDIGSVPDPERRLDFGYGGLTIGYYAVSRDRFDVKVQTLFGGGNVGYRDIDQRRTRDRDMFFAVEPGIQFGLKPHGNIKIVGGVSYRHVMDTDLEGFSDRELSGITGSAGIMIGRF